MSPLLPKTFHNFSYNAFRFLLIVASNFSSWIFFEPTAEVRVCFINKVVLLRCKQTARVPLLSLFFITAFRWYYSALNPISSHSIFHADKLNFIWMLGGREILFWKIDSKCEALEYVKNLYIFKVFFVVIKATQKWD